MKWPTVVINDVCGDDNGRGRIRTRLLWGIENSVFDSPTMIAPQSTAQAYFELLDQIDALRNSPGVIFINVAPRDGEGSKQNGSPFGYVKYGNKHIFTTVDGLTLPLFQRHLGQRLNPLVYEISDENLAAIGFPEHQWSYIKQTQFRSYEYQLDFGQAFLTEKPLRPTTQDVSHLEAGKQFAAVVDTFGNIKTTAMPEEVHYVLGKTLPVRINGDVLELKCYQWLTDPPSGELALVIGSSGRWDGEQNRRGLEVVVKHGNAVERIFEQTNVRIHPGHPLTFG